MVSVIVPVYNAEKYLRKCIDTICNQTYRDLEIILVDDGSTDGSLSICDELADKDKRIKVIHKPNGGSTSARNAGLAAATGEYIGFIDSDDWIEPEMYEVLWKNCIENQADIAVVNKFINHEKSQYQDVLHVLPGIYEKNDGVVVKNIIYTEDYSERGISPNLWDKLFKRELILLHQAGIDERTKFAEDDICVYSALLDADRVVIIDEALYHYRMHAESVCHTPDDTYFEKINLFYLQMKKIFLEHKDADLLMQKLKKYMLEFVLRGVNYSFGFSKHPLIPFFIPPYEILKSNNVKNVVLYGAGRVGQDYYQAFQTSKYIDVVAWVDRQYEDYRRQGMPVDAVESIVKVECDGILIAVENAELADRIKKSLIELGIQETILLWEKSRTVISSLEDELL